MKCILILVLQFTYFDGFYSTNKSALQILLQGQKSRITKRSLSESNNAKSILNSEAIQKDLVIPLEIILPKKKLLWKRKKTGVAKRRNFGEHAKNFSSSENLILKRDMSDIHKNIKPVSADNENKSIFKDSRHDYENNFGAERRMFYQSENLSHHKREHIK